MTDSVTPALEVPGKVAGLVITGVVVAIIVGWIALWQGLLKMEATTLFGGFLLLWYWANNEGMEFRRLPATIIGALVGIFLAWFVVYATGAWGGAGTLAALLLIIAALYLDVIKALPIAINASTMLFLTVAAAPLVQLSVNWTQLALSIGIGGLVLGCAIEGLKRLAARGMAPAA